MWSNEDPRFSGIYKYRNILVYDSIRKLVATGSCETKHGFSVLIDFDNEADRVISDNDIWPATWWWCFAPGV